MKKLFIILTISTILLTGCTVTRLNNKSIDEIIDSTILSNDSRKLKNTSYDGYSYYLPRELYFVNKNDYNSIMKDINGNYYYFYTDVVSYYHKIKKKYKEDSNAYYSRKIENKKKFGYFEINEQQDTYYIEAMYNYTKVEAVVKKKNLNDCIVNICMILKTMKYNDKILETTVGENALDYKEETYNIFETKKDTSNFLNYINEFDNVDDADKDEDKVKMDEEE